MYADTALFNKGNIGTMCHNLLSWLSVYCPTDSVLLITNVPWPVIYHSTFNLVYLQQKEEEQFAATPVVA